VLTGIASEWLADGAQHVGAAFPQIPNEDQVLATVTMDRERYHLAPSSRGPQRDERAAAYLYETLPGRKGPENARLIICALTGPESGFSPSATYTTWQGTPQARRPRAAAPVNHAARRQKPHVQLIMGEPLAATYGRGLLSGRCRQRTRIATAKRGGD